MSIISIGSKVIIPQPQEDDTWHSGMVSEVEDINDGTIMFMDDDYTSHEIEVSRVQLYNT